MKTILIVDDDKNQLLLYEQELSLEGYHVVTAMDGLEAVKKVKEQTPDLIIMDLFIPNMNGIEAMSSILSQRRKIPIIINTAYSGYKDNFMSWLANAYIIKSSNLNELKDTIKKLIGKIEKSDGSL
ncbi:MAG: response regulator [Candidatus Jettenia sp.]|uniref:Two-component response regulator n=1 Tax=Candidatus Jettenia caeni TaxID=247490 RepID=I3INE9_9BACT|nr:response regulator [Candidatus Jettenia sp. AMX1]MBC6927933.1 response regulator [Candidatus Jettenia sp.]NUN21839.1 response regulator [Candidatus Jettenia caeni]KAA0248253.1 MAG: response regulator [Candidatus Jettenia sp. AMX1]MCE7879535.1 response regulator [Candidatus Jettenia sp. AMX1]MDL1937840.1 response regulator [Candidatus Jettenia sp. AMX1]